jgi:hypothetical protein
MKIAAAPEGRTAIAEGKTPVDMLPQPARQMSVQHSQLGLCGLGRGASSAATSFVVHITTPSSAVV